MSGEITTQDLVGNTLKMPSLITTTLSNYYTNTFYVKPPVNTAFTISSVLSSTNSTNFIICEASIRSNTTDASAALLTSFNVRNNSGTMTTAQFNTQRNASSAALNTTNFTITFTGSTININVLNGLNMSWFVVVRRLESII